MLLAFRGEIVIRDGTNKDVYRNKLKTHYNFPLLTHFSVSISNCNGKKP